jgi:alpha-amylase
MQNGCMMQGFHWYTPADGSLWQTMTQRAQDWAKSGFTAIWMPPAYKGLAGGYDVGYGVYDMYDLGEFDQKGSVRTKYGTRDQYLTAVKALQNAGIQAYADVVLNHRMGADDIEQVNATPFEQSNRLHPAGPTQPMETYTHYAFPGRGGEYSDFQWRWWHFDAVDYNHAQPDDRGKIYLLEGKQFDDFVALDQGNYGYLMGCDLDFQHGDVREEVHQWGRWYLDTTHVDGFRLDAVKHISSWFFPQWLDQLRDYRGTNMFVMGEYWQPDLYTLLHYLDATGNRMSVFDVPLHYNFHRASKMGQWFDMRTLLDNSLMVHRPTQAVTFVENHDSQPLQALESPVDPWFKPMAYAVILLRAEGYPCVFAADYDGAQYEDRGRDGNRYAITMPSFKPFINQCLAARQHFAWGPQLDYFDHPRCVGWTRHGDDTHLGQLAVLMSNGDAGHKWMNAGKPHTRFTDLTHNQPGDVWSNADGWACFTCQAGSVSIWVSG